MSLAGPQERFYWHASLFAARLGLAGVILLYLYIVGGVADGGLSLSAVLGVLGVYIVATLLVGVVSRGRELTPRLRRVQTLLDNGALALGAPYDPGTAMPVLFFLAINPLEFGVRYGLESYWYAVSSALVASAIIVITRITLVDTGLAPEAIGLLIFAWVAVLYGLVTVFGMQRTRSDYSELLRRHEDAMRTVRFVTWTWSVNHPASYVNPAIDTLMGLPAGTYDGRMETFFRYVHEADRDKAREEMEQSRQLGKGFEIRFRCRAPGGEIRWLASRGEVISRDDDGEVSAMTGVIWDIDAEMQARVQADKTLARVEAAIEIGGIAFWEIDAETRTLDYDSAGRRAGNGPPPGPVPLDQVLHFISEADRDNFTRTIDIAIKRGTPINGAFWWVRPSGERVHMRAFGNIRRNHNDEVISIAGVSIDDTRQILAQQEIEKALAKVDAAAAASNIGFWSRDARTGKLELDENWRRILGYDADAPLPDFEQALAYIHPDDRVEYLRVVAEALAGNDHLHHEYRIIRADTGEVRHFQIRGDAVRNEHGDVISHTGFLMDQTDAIQLRKEAERARKLLDTALSAVKSSAVTAFPATNSIDFVGEAQHMIGVSEDTPLDQLDAVLAYIPESDRADVERAIRHTMDTGEPLSQIYRVPHARTGELQWHHLRGQVFHSGDEQGTGIVGVITDETAAVERRNEIEALRTRYDQALRAASVGGWTWFVERDVLEFDPILYQIHEIDPETFPGNFQALLDTVHEDDREAYSNQIHDAVETGSSFELRYRRVLRNGGTRWTMTRGEAVELNETGTANRIAGATWDITELAQLNQALERSNRELDDFAHVASHDLREPLRGLHNYSKFLEEDYADQLDDEGRRMLAALGRLSQRLDDLISDLLNFSRVGRTELAIEPTDLNQIVDAVLETLEFSIQDRGIEIRKPEPLPTVRCDRVRVAELYRNLISNAIKYNDKQDKWIEIAHHDGVFRVRDNGIGIPPQHFERIFSIFKRLHTRDAFGGGTGAGLTIVKRIIERHGGRIWVESEPGEGSCFSFILAERRKKPRD